MRHGFEYCVLRAVPRVERGECVNVGVVLYCAGLGFLAARTHIDAARLCTLDAAVDVTQVEAHLRSITLACAGDEAAGAIAQCPIGPRFRWLVAPRSTIIQPSPVHTGLTEDPAGELEHLLRVLVMPPR